MPLGILEDKYLENVPGTVPLLDLQQGDTKGQKYGEGIDSHVILVPQPSDDPHDPLNWPRWRKECLFWVLSFGAGLVGAIGHLLNPGFVVLSREWGVSVDTVAATNNTLILALGCIMLVQAPLAVKYGRRPVYIVAALLLFFCSIWSALSQGLSSFTGSRVLQGFGEAPFEALVTATIADIYFVHQRGLRTAIWSFAITAGINTGPLVNGYIIDSKLGWRFCFWLITIAFGFLLAGIVFLVPETTYDRDNKFETDIDPRTREVESDAKDTSSDEKIDVSTDAMVVQVEKRRFLKELSPWNGHVHQEILSYGMASSSNISAAQTGLVSIGPLLGSIVAAAISGPLCDYATTEFARRNNGIYEPESRLFLLIPMFILQVFGYMGWALMASHNVHWIGPVMMYTIINVGQGIGTTGAVAYIIDVHRKNAAECFALINFIKDIILYGFARFANSWVSDMGVLKTFGILAGLSAISILTTVPMYMYGKRARSFIARHQRLPLLFALLFPTIAYAADTKNLNGNCSQSHNQLEIGTYELIGDCGDTQFCNSTGFCQDKGCRKNEFPLGYAQNAVLPPKCPSDQFCPDEGDACQPLLAVGSPCQLNRDDECAPPPNFKELADRNFNHNGSVCINFQCFWANATLNEDCVDEQMPYIAFGSGNDEFIYVVSRGNCMPGLYCDASKKSCLQQKLFGDTCTADKECESNNCSPSLTCGVSPQAPKHFAIWVYVVVGLGIIGGMIGTLVGLYLLHSRTREEEREKRTQYWREQNAFRQNILQMRDTAKASLLSLSLQGQETPRSSAYNPREHITSEDSSMGILHRNSAQRAPQDDIDQESIHGETPMLLPADQETFGWNPQRNGGRR